MKIINCGVKKLIADFDSLHHIRNRILYKLVEKIFNLPKVKKIDHTKKPLSFH